MTTLRNPHAALHVGKIIKTHLDKSELSYSDLAHKLQVSDAKIDYWVTGRHYIPLEHAKVIADTLGISPGELVYHMLLQYFTKVEVDGMWEAIATHILAQQELDKGETEDGRSEKKKKKKKKSR